MKTRRFTIDMGEAADSLLTGLSDDTGMTKAEIVRRSIAVYAYLLKETKNVDDRKISVTDFDGRILKELVIL